MIGAGASKEANLPTGYELKAKVATLLDIFFDFNQQKKGDHQIVSALRALVKTQEGNSGDINPYISEAWHIRDALPQAISIDNFIDSQRGNEKIAICGKLAIVKSILEAEKHSSLYYDKYGRTPGINFINLESTWYLPFFQLLTESCEASDLEDRLRSVVLIIFNYDRCVEHFLYHALQNYYRISANSAAELLKAMCIYHPYGSVGALPWGINSGSMDFGADANSNQLLELTNRIKTFSEGTDPEASYVNEIKMHMGTAEKLVFIGFAFHKLNMELIRPEYIENVPKCYATTFGISESDKEVICSQINGLYKEQVYIRMASTECCKFFTEFWRSLAF